MMYELMTDLQYRINFLFGFLGTIGWLFGELAFLHFLIGQYDSIAGWDFYEMALLVGINQIWVGGLFYFMVWPSLSTFAEYIRTGELDRILVRPIESKFYLSVFRIDWPSLAIAFTGFIVVCYSLLHIPGSITISSVLSFIPLLILSCWIVYNVQFIASCSAFWITNAGSAIYIIGAIDRLSRFPYEIFTKGIVFILFTFVVPITIISNVPARALLGILEFKYVLFSLFIGLVLFMVSRIVWKLGLRRYESASS